MTHAVGRRISGTSQSSSLVVAVIGGLVLGVLLALLSTLVVPLRARPG